MRSNARGVRPVLEILAVLTALALHYVLTRGVGVRGLDIAPITVCVLAYALIRGRDPSVRRDWGTTTAGFGACARAVVPFLLAGTAVCAWIGWQRGHLAVDGHLLLTFLIYPLWGTAQQFLVLGLFAHNLDLLGMPRRALLAVSAAGFAAAHVPNWPQVGATFVLGAVCTALFFRHRNLWPLGVVHGVLGALFYRWVLGVDVGAVLFTQCA
jgi:hypothetical protein